MTKSSTILGAAVVGLAFILIAYSLQTVQKRKVVEPSTMESFQVPPTVLPKHNTATDNPLTRATKFSETAHPARIENEGEDEGFQSYLNPYDYPSPSISQAYEFRLDRKSLMN